LAAEIHGSCDPRFARVAEAFAGNFDAGLEIGASLGITLGGRSVVDLWGGWTNPERAGLWQADTLVSIASTTKIAVTTATLKLVSDGRLELDAPVAAYWPEFAQGGKARVTVREALSHRAGVPGFDPPAPPDIVFDWEAMTARIAAEPHWFGGRPTLCYHLNTYGFLLGELIRRVDGRLPNAYFREEIAGPLGIDFHIGLSEESDGDRVTLRVYTPVPFPPEPAGSLGAKMLASIGTIGVPPTGKTLWELRSALLPSGNGYANGRSIAALMTIHAMRGSVGGVRILTDQVADEVFREQAYEDAYYIGWWREGLGLGLHCREYPGVSTTSGEWGGIGGSLGIADPAAGVGFGYAPNNWNISGDGVGFHREPRHVRLLTALRADLADLARATNRPWQDPTA
jgi:CubicO group peptidase (beta-lactamase class C family)